MYSNFVALAGSCVRLLSFAFSCSLAFSCFLLLAAARLGFQFEISSIQAELILNNLNSSWRTFTLLCLLLLAVVFFCFLVLPLIAPAFSGFLLLSFLSLACCVLLPAAGRYCNRNWRVGSRLESLAPDFRRLPIVDCFLLAVLCFSRNETESV